MERVRRVAFSLSVERRHTTLIYSHHLWLLMATAFMANYQAAPAQTSPLWTHRMADPNSIRAGSLGFLDGAHYSGIAQWDESSVIVYSLVKTGHLGERDSSGHAQGAWQFKLQVLDVESGEAGQSATIPAASADSGLIVVIGGLVVSEPARLLFYSRTFQPTGKTVAYTPLASSLYPTMGLRPSSSPMYVTLDQQAFTLLDFSSHQAQFLLFDGRNFEVKSKGIIQNINPSSFSVSNQYFLFSDPDLSRNVFIGNFDGTIQRWPLLSTGKNECHHPSYLSPNRFVDVCGSIALVKGDQSEILYKPRNHELLIPPAVISKDGQFAAVLNEDLRGAGILDLDVKTTGSSIVIVRLNSNHQICTLPLKPKVSSQMTFAFANNSTLVVLKDGLAAAYRTACN